MKFDIESFRIMDTVAEKLDDELAALLATRVVSFSESRSDFYVTFKNDVGLYVHEDAGSYYLTIVNNSIPYLDGDTPNQIMGLDRLKFYLRYASSYSEPSINAQLDLNFEEEEQYEEFGV